MSFDKFVHIPWLLIGHANLTWGLKESTSDPATTIYAASKKHDCTQIKYSKTIRAQYHRFMAASIFCLLLFCVGMWVPAHTTHAQADDVSPLRAELTTNRREAIAFDQIFWTLELYNDGAVPLAVHEVRFEFDTRLHHFRVRRLTDGDALLIEHTATARNITIPAGEKVTVQFDGEVDPSIEQTGDYRPLTHAATIVYGDDARIMQSNTASVTLSPLPTAPLAWWWGLVALGGIMLISFFMASYQNRVNSS